MVMAVTMPVIIVLVGGLLDNRRLGGVELQPIAHFHRRPAVIHVVRVFE
jgi:hypothetical protein